MSNYATLIESIQSVITQNGNNEITGPILQQTLISIINSLGTGYQFIGVATPETIPGSPDQKVFYIGSSGTYPNFGPVTIQDGNLGVFYYDSTWHVASIAFPVGDGTITESKLDAVLVGKLFESGFKYAGIAVPSTNPGTPNQNIFYVASIAGTYTHFNGITIAQNEFAILKYNGSTWVKETTDLVIQDMITELSLILSAGWVEFSNYTITDNKYVNVDGNNATNSSYREYSIDVAFNECYRIRCNVNSSSVYSVAFFDNGNKFMKWVSVLCSVTTDTYKDYFVKVPQGAVKMVISALKSGTITILRTLQNDYNRDVENMLKAGFEENPTSITESGKEYGYYVRLSDGSIAGTSGNTTRRLDTFEVVAGQVFLIDCRSLTSSAATIAFYNDTTIGSSSYMSDFSIAGTSSQNHIVVVVPTGAVRMCITSAYDSSYVYNVRRSTIGLDLNKYIDLSSVQALAAQVALMETNVNKGVSVYDNLEYDYYADGQPLTPSNTITNLYLRSDTRKLASANNAVWRIYTFPKSVNDRWLRIKQYVESSSIAIGGAFLVDDTSVIVAGTTIPTNDIIISPSSAPVTIDKSVFVPAGRILCISHSTYTSTNYCNVYNAVFGSKVINDILQDIDDLQNNIQETVEDAIDNTLSVDAIPSLTNPLAVIKETPGYTSIFRKMGVIGGSMSTGWHSHTTGSVSANMPEYSSIQFVARLCGSVAYNFSRGGMSARSWPANDMIDRFDADHKCQLYLIQLGNNDLAYHSDHPEYTLGTIADLTPTGGTTIADFTYNTGTFYGNMARIINEIRKMQPRAYVFLSTFLKGYGGIPSDFDYNQAIRNIVEYFTTNNGANRPVGDELHYYLIDIWEFGAPYSYYYTGVHAGTVKGSHLVATGYLHWAYEYCTYIDWIIKNNMSEFNDVAFVGTDDYN